ncbi:hypothetical protein EVG20_g9482 [Dentipellis fragilis]|uniref:Uncharacterized protein n=1 Tax=Dentipellis fragilis TaxID=205917 RepID=A0A4Y9Y289_9AGAM|nr:hypothetical protein EVG20_g9482 [Dentipellis fragilis]
MAQLALYEIAVDVGSHGVSAAFGSFFRFAKKPFPGQQIRAGDEYMERALSLSEQYYDLFDDEERRQVADVYSQYVVRIYTIGVDAQSLVVLTA